ncbi:MAG: NAD-dependent deacylase [Burkholderiales bacterium]|nr:NAD-dependent deacylase [Burkholderiales bacterium]
MTAHATARVPEAAARALQEARSVAVLTGAGISAESGVPTFRDAQTGLWARYRAEDLATPEAFARDPVLLWNWYLWRRRLVGEAAPNAGHLALVELERRVPAFTLVTQNVDGLHRRAGSRAVVELHGCLLQGRRLDDGAVVEFEDPPAGQMPVCPQTGARLRPNVVWFGEMLPAVAMVAAREAAESCDLMLVVGTSGLVYPAAGLPAMAAEAGAKVMEVNPVDTPLTPLADWALRGGAATVLPALLARAFGTASAD